MFTAIKSQLTPAETEMVGILLKSQESRTLAIDFLKKRFGVPQRVALMLIQTWNDPEEVQSSKTRFAGDATFDGQRQTIALIGTIFLAMMAALSAGVMFG